VLGEVRCSWRRSPKRHQSRRGHGGELGPVVSVDERPVSTALAKDLRGSDCGFGVDGVLDEIGQGLAGEVVDEVQALDYPPRGGPIPKSVRAASKMSPTSRRPTTVSSSRSNCSTLTQVASSPGSRSRQPSNWVAWCGSGTSA
jgi:hypothetical protein